MTLTRALGFSRAFACWLFGHRPISAVWMMPVSVGPYDWRLTGRECERCGKRRATKVRLIRRSA